MSVLDTQTVRRRHNRRVSPRSGEWAAVGPEDTAWDVITLKTVRRPRPASHRGRAGGRAVPEPSIGAVVVNGAARLGMSLMRWSGGILWRALGVGFRLVVIAAVLVGRAVAAIARLTWDGIVAAMPHVRRGVRSSAMASARLGRRMAVRTRVQARNQAEYMRDGMPDVRGGMARTRRLVRGLGRIAVRRIQRAGKRGFFGWPGIGRVLRASVLGTSSGALVVGGAAAVLLGPTAVEQSEALAITQIDLTGHERLGREEILAAADVDVGDNLATVDLERVADEIRALPWVASVSLRRLYPDRFVIHVEEREPALLLADGSLWFVDTDGEVFKPVETGEWLDLPVVTGMTLEDRIADPDGCRRRLRQAVYLAEKFASASAVGPADIGELRLLDNGEFLVMTAREGVALRLDGEEVERGLQRLDMLVERDLLSLNAVTAVDLALRNQVVATRKVEL